MDKFTNFNGEDTYGDPQYNGYGEEHVPEHSGYTGYDETDNFSNSDNVEYDASATYTAQVYDGVRLMDITNSNYNTPEYDAPTFDQSGYNEEAYSDTQSDNFAFESIEYSDTPSLPQEASENNLDDSLFSPLYPEGYAPAASPDSVFHPTIEDAQRDMENLTEAELEDIQRQKAAARRKRRAAKERRRRQRRKQAIIRCSILLAIVILLIVGLVMLISGIVNHAKEKKKERELSEFYATSEITTEEPVADIDEAITAKEIPTDRDAALAILQEQAAEDSTMQSICDSAAAMPDILLQHLAVNPELKDFTLSYPAMISIVFDGEFDIELEGNEVPLYLQFDKRWGYADYSEDIIGLRGAGPTCLSMACTYLLSDGSKNPIKVADYATEMGYLNDSGKTHWSLMTDGAEGLGLVSTELTVNKEDMIEALEDGKVLICKVRKGDFTTDEHFLVIRDYKDGFFYINDPNSTARSQVGWDFKRLRGQIEKLCALEAGTSSTTTGDDAAGDDAAGDDASGDDSTGDDSTGDDSTPNNGDDNQTGDDNEAAPAE